jgi:DNA primase
MKGYPPEEMAAAGLLVSSEDGILRDRFRHRLMFPIRDAQGRLVGFGARALTVQDHPKYLNSPQTDLFDKGSLLYGIHRAATAIREQSQAVIVEGYMDVIIAHQHGFSNTVASMGTALTERQVSQLRRLASRVILALDADAAGAEATLRSLEDAWDVFRRRPRDDHNAGIGARAVPDTILSVLTMPSGKDPDEVILESPQEWERLLSTALPLLDYLLEALAQRVDLATDAGKTQALKLLMPLVLRLPDVSSQDRYTQKVAELVDVDQELLRRMLPELTRRTRKRQEHLLEQAVGTTPSGDPLEQYLIRLLYFYPDLMERVQEVLEPSHFLHTEHWELLQALVHWEQMQESGQELDTTLQEYLQALVARPLPAIKPRDRQKAVQDCITRLEERRIRLLKAQEEQRFLDKSKALESSEEVEHLYQQAVELNQRLRQVLVQRES